ncbi:Eco57I restriction-modification methylase domain-containing protein [soil metagenome]
MGSLTAALVTELCTRVSPPKSIFVLAYEIDPSLIHFLSGTLESCRSFCSQHGVAFDAEIRQSDFVIEASGNLAGGLFQRQIPSINCAILNPPYRKINSTSSHRATLRSAGIETSNLYTAFLALAIGLLGPLGEMVAITPRSFCNGPYFKPFRKMLLDEMAIERIHVFESRSRAFKEDEVLQENIIIHAAKQTYVPSFVDISESADAESSATVRRAAYAEMVRPDDPDRFIHIVPDESGRNISSTMRRLHTQLAELGLGVSTGRVVDFRAKGFLRAEAALNTVPLIYPGHFVDGYVAWPQRDGKKPNALIRSSETEELMVPSGIYVLVKRFSAKEEPRRIVAAIYDPKRLPETEVVGFENHLNYFHAFGEPLPRALALGLAAFLNSQMVDTYFRQFNGHTQVNATDLRNLAYPTYDQLEVLGQYFGNSSPSAADIDDYLEERILSMVSESPETPRNIPQKKISECLEILSAIARNPKMQTARL